MEQSIIWASDAHIWRPDEKQYAAVDAFCAAVEQLRPHTFSEGGDWRDPWQGKDRDIDKTAAWQRYYEMCAKRAEQGLVNFKILGNHDRHTTQEQVPWAFLATSWVAPLANVRYEFRHGWEFDLSWRGFGPIPGVSRIAFWIALNHPGWMLPLYRLLFGPTPGEKKEKLLNPPPSMFEENRDLTKDRAKRDGLYTDWTLHIEGMRMRARQYAAKNNLFLIQGHTHCCENSLMVADSGDLTNDRKYLLIDNSGVRLEAF